MKRHLIAVLCLCLTLPALAQSGAAAPADPVVATINGEVITSSEFEELWKALPEPLRVQYETQGGGKAGFLETTVLKKLIVQEALKSGLGERPEARGETPAKRDAALFDLYVHDVMADRVIKEETMLKFYEVNRERFGRPAQAKMWLIAVTTEERTPDEAKTRLGEVAQQLFPLRAQAARSGNFGPLLDAFAAIAQKVSEHESAMNGGDLGWINPDDLEPKLAEAARMVPTRQMSGVLAIPDKGFAIVLIEDRREAQIAPFEEVRGQIRELLLPRARKAMMDATMQVARDLRATGEVKLNLAALK